MYILALGCRWTKSPSGSLTSLWKEEQIELSMNVIILDACSPQRDLTALRESVHFRTQILGAVLSYWTLRRLFESVEHEDACKAHLSFVRLFRKRKNKNN